MYGDVYRDKVCFSRRFELYLMPENNKSSDMTMKKAYKTNRAGCIFMHLPAPVIFDNAFPLPCHGLSFGCAESPPGG
jgi:hypothetical protein